MKRYIVRNIMRGNLIRHSAIIRLAALALLALCTVHSPAHARPSAINAGAAQDSRNSFSAIYPAVVTLSFYSSSSAQTPRERLGIEPPQQEPQQTEEEKKAAKELEKKTMALIDELVAEAMALSLAENRVHILTSASDLLWAHDEERARSIARKAMDQVAADMRKAMEKSAQEDGQRFDSRPPLQSDASYSRQTVLSLLARRDAKMASEFIRLTRPLQLPDNAHNPREERMDKALELNVASQIAENDPQTALRIASEYLSGKFDYQVLRFWGVLLRKDPKAASTLTARIISNLKSQDILADDEAIGFVLNVLDVLRSRANEIAEARNIPDAANAAQHSSAEIQQAYRLALEIVAATAIRITFNHMIDDDESFRARKLLAKIPDYLADIKKFLPSRFAAVRAKVAKFVKPAYADQREKFYTEYGSDLHNKPPQELIALASKAPQEFRKNFIYMAINKAIEQGDEETARKIIMENFTERRAANDELASLDAIISMRAVSEGRYADARRFLVHKRADEQRASTLAEWSSTAAGKGDEKSAREMLEEARAIMGSRIQSRDQLEAQVAIADASLNLDPNVSFKIAEAAIERLNRLFAANLEFQTFGGMEEAETRIKDGVDWDGYTRHTRSYDRLFAALARKDFDRVVNLFRRWPSNEIRLLMSLTLVENILGR